MPDTKLDSLGAMVAKKRGKLGVRVTAKTIGISPATLSRVENGHLPDLENFRKICAWLEEDPSQILGIEVSKKSQPVASVHFRKEQTMQPETASALGEVILAVQRAVTALEDQ